MSTRRTRWFDWWRLGMLIVGMAWTISAVAQESANRAEPASPGSAAGPASDEIRELREQIRALQAAVAGMRSDWQNARAETAELRRELDEVRAGTGPRNAVLREAVVNAAIGAPQDDNQDPTEDQKKGDYAATLDEEYQLLSGKVDDQYQTKVESASKYRLRLSGIVLMNLASNQGVVNSVDLPTLAYARPAGDSGGTFGATLRQSEIGLEAFGPTLAGAKTRADLQLDLAGGYPSIPNGSNSGLLRPRS